jgi:hypothetical protein
MAHIIAQAAHHKKTTPEGGFKALRHQPGGQTQGPLIPGCSTSQTRSKFL